MPEISDYEEMETDFQNDPSEVMSLISSLVDKGEIEDVNKLVQSGKNDKELGDITWDLVPLLCTFLTEDRQNDKPATIKACEIVLAHLCKVSKPKELILVLLEQCNAFSDDIKFKVLLAPIQKSLLSLKVKRSHSVAMALETLYTHIRTLPLPKVESQNLEGRERSMLHMDPAVRRICDILKALLDFIVPFVNIATDKSENYDDHQKERTDIINTLIKILNQPLMHLDLSHSTEDVLQFKTGMRKETTEKSVAQNLKTARPKSEARVIAEQIADLFQQLHPNYIKLFELAEQHNAKREAQLKEIWNQRDKDAQGDQDEDIDDYGVPEEIPPGGVSCLIYLALGEKLGIEHFPCVYTAQYLFEFSLPIICAFLEKPVTFQVEKGVRLLTSVTEPVTNGSLGSEYIGLESLANCIKYLIKVIVHCPSKEARQNALKIVPLILSKFDNRGKYLYIQFMLKKAEHPGLEGYVVNMLKDQVDNTLKLETPCEYFVGSNLEKLLGYIFILPEGATSDLLEGSDRILGALNLLRYLVLRDKPEQNATGIWDVVEKIEKNYCAPLRTGVNMSRAHYKLEMDKTRAGEYKPKRGQEEPEMSVSVGNDTVPNLSTGQQLHVLQRALYTFDMIDSVLGRVAELIDQQHRQAQKN